MSDDTDTDGPCLTGNSRWLQEDMRLKEQIRSVMDKLGGDCKPKNFRELADLFEGQARTARENNSRTLLR